MTEVTPNLPHFGSFCKYCFMGTLLRGTPCCTYRCRMWIFQGASYSGRTFFCFALNLLTHGFQLLFSNTPPAHHSKSNRHSPAGIVDEVVQLCPLHHGYIKCILQGQCNLLLHERASTNIQPYTRCRLNSLTRTLVSLNAANILISVPLLTFLSQSWYNANVQEGVYVL